MICLYYETFSIHTNNKKKSQQLHSNSLISSEAPNVQKTALLSLSLFATNSTLSMQSQWKVTKITKYKKCTVCIHRCAWYMYDSRRLVKYHRIILPTPPRNINAQRKWFIKDHTQHPWQAWTSAYFFQVKQKYLFSLLLFSVNSSGTSQSLNLTFPYRRTDVVHQITYPWLATKPAKHLRTEGPTPYVSYQATTALQVRSALWRQKAERNFNLFFLQGNNVSIMSHVAWKIIEIRILYSGFQVKFQFSRIQSSQRTDKIACCMK